MVVDSFTPATSGKTSRRDRDRKKSDNNRDNTKDGNRKGGPLRVNDNRNQVRNARNSNWNQKGGRGRYQNNQSSSVPATQRKFHELPESLEYEVVRTAIITTIISVITIFVEFFLFRTSCRLFFFDIFGTFNNFDLNSWFLSQ